MGLDCGAGRNELGACHTADGRVNGAIGKLDFGRLNGGLICANNSLGTGGTCPRLIELLRGNDAFLVKSLAAFKVRLAKLCLGFVSGERCFSLCKGGEEGFLIQSDQQVPLADKLSLLVMDYLDNTGNLRLDGDGLEGLPGSDGG